MCILLLCHSRDTGIGLFYFINAFTIFDYRTVIVKHCCWVSSAVTARWWLHDLLTHSSEYIYWRNASRCQEMSQYATGQMIWKFPLLIFKINPRNWKWYFQSNDGCFSFKIQATFLRMTPQTMMTLLFLLLIIVSFIDEMVSVSLFSSNKIIM